jgi:uncharacterized membrane protein YphA (DoxX/SURF4 family)
MVTKKNIFILLSLFLGGFMIYGGIGKFSKPMPTTTFLIEKIEKEGIEAVKADPKLKIRNYISGLKQTGFFWQFLGICELLFGLMIVSQYLRFVGATMLLPITIQIFLFHLFLESDEIGELLNTGLLLAINLLLIFENFKEWKPLLINKWK